MRCFYRGMNRELFNGRGGVFGGREWNDQIGELAVFSQKLAELERDLALSAGWHREDARLEHSVADPFEQRGVLRSANVFFVGLAGFLGVEELRVVLLAIDHERHAVDRAVVR